MTDATARFGLPLILPGQAQKELFHNEALAGIDAVLHPAVEGPAIDAPPASPQPGQCWLVGAGAGGAWMGRDNDLAVWTTGGWRFMAPQTGMWVWDKSAGYHRRWSGTAWTNGELSASALTIGGVQIVGARQPALPSASGGSIIDQEARAVLQAITVALKSHGLVE